MSHELNLILSATDKASRTIDRFGGHVDTLGHKIKNVLSYAGISAGLGAVVIAIKKTLIDSLDQGFDAMENFRMSAASIASMITTFAEDTENNLAETYQEAYGYAQALVLEMEKLDAKTISTGKDLAAMVETLIQGGVLLDIQNKKQVEGFLAIANALKLTTQGQNQDIQIRQELRALLDGQIKQTSRLATILDAKVGGTLKENLAKWKEQGTVIEEVGALLGGFQEGTKDIENTWTAVKSTLETISNAILRGIMTPTYLDILDTVKGINSSLMENKDTTGFISLILREGIYNVWMFIKETVRAIAPLIKSIAQPLLGVTQMVSMIFKGWAGIASMLVPIANRIKYIVDTVWQWVKGLTWAADALVKFATFDFKGGERSLTVAGKYMIESNKSALKAIQGGLLEEFEENLIWMIKKTKGMELPETPKAPRMQAFKDEEERQRQIRNTLKAAQAKYAHLETLSENHIENEKLRIEKEKILTEQAFEDEKITATEYYDKLVNLAQELTEIEVQELEKRRKYTQDYFALQLKANPEQRKAIEEKLADEIAKIDGEILRLKAKTENRIIELNHERSQKIKEIEADLKNYTYGQLQGMLKDEFTAAEKRIEIREEMRKRILAGEASSWEAFKFGWHEVGNEALETYKRMIDNARKTAETIQNLFSDLLFDALTGRMKSFKDYWRSFWNSMARIISDELAKQVYGELFGSGGLFGKISTGGGGGSGLGGIVGSLFGAFFGGSLAGPTAAGMNTNEALRSAIAQFAGGLPSFQHGGLVTHPMIAQIGEVPELIIPISKLLKGGTGKSPVYNINIHAVDALSFHELCKRNPAAVIEPFLQNISTRGAMVDAVREAL